MEMSMETTPTPVSAPRTPLRVAGVIAGWVAMALATLVVLALVATTVGPRLLPYQALVVRSGSMSPTIPTGSIVFYRKREASKVKVGDIIAFAKPGQPDEKVTHRVYQIGSSSSGRYFVTKGDANAAPDNWRVPALGTGWIASFHVPAAGYVLADLQSQLGRLLLLLIPAILLGAITLWELWRGRHEGAAPA